MPGKHLIAILPNVDFDEHNRVPPNHGFLNMMATLIRRVDQDTKSITLVTFRKVTADLAQSLLHGCGMFYLPMPRYTLLRKALLQKEFNGEEKSAFDLVTVDEDLQKDDADAWHHFCLRMVRIGCCHMSHVRSPHDFWRYPAFNKDSFIQHWKAPSMVYIVPGYQAVDAVMPSLDMVAFVEKTMERLKKDDDAVVVFVGGRTGETLFSEAMLLSSLLLVSDVAPRRDMPSRVAFLPVGSTFEEKAEQVSRFVQTVAVGAAGFGLIFREQKRDEVLQAFKCVEDRVKEWVELKTSQVAAPQPPPPSAGDDIKVAEFSEAAEVAEIAEDAADVAGATEIAEAAEMAEAADAAEAREFGEVAEAAEVTEMVDAVDGGAVAEVEEVTESLAAVDVEEEITAPTTAIPNGIAVKAETQDTGADLNDMEAEVDATRIETGKANAVEETEMITEVQADGAPMAPGTAPAQSEMADGSLIELIPVDITTEELVAGLTAYVKYHPESVLAQDRLENLKEGVDELTVREHAETIADSAEKEKSKSRRDSRRSSSKKEHSRKDSTKKKSRSLKKKKEEEDAAKPVTSTA